MQVYKDANGRLLLKLGDIDIDYNPTFRLFLTSRNPNPHFLPEVHIVLSAWSLIAWRGTRMYAALQVCIRVTVINFTVTAEGLEEQLLGDCVRRERPDLEEQRDSLLQSIAADKRQLQARPSASRAPPQQQTVPHSYTDWCGPYTQELEDRMLRLLREAGESLLDDEALLSTLNNSRSTSAAINTRVMEAQATEASINAARESYRPAAARASTLYFVVSGLSAIDTMCACSALLRPELFHGQAEGVTELYKSCAGIKLRLRMSRASSTAAWKPHLLLLLCQTVWQTLPPR